MRQACLVAAAAGLLTLGASATAAEPFLDQVNIFEAGSGGYAHYRVPAIVVSARGTVLAFAEARKSTRGDWGTQDIVMRRSTDGGKTWAPPRMVARVDGAVQPNPVAVSQNLGQPGEPTYNNAVPIVDRDSGALHLLFCVEYARCYAMHSEDDAETFSDAVDITPVFEQFRTEYDWKVIATGPGHGIQLESGRLVVPVWLSDGSGGHAHRPSIVAVVYSDDHGATWRRGQVVVRHPRLKNPSETIAIQLADGRVMFNIRNEAPEHRRAVSYSEDGVSGWTEPEFHKELLEPICMASIVRLSAQPQSSRNRILFANPHSSEPRDPGHPEGSHKRQNVTIQLSYDEGRSWPVAKSLEPGVSGYSDLAAGPDGTIYCIYERGTASEGGVQFLTVARFNLEWLTGGRDSL